MSLLTRSPKVTIPTKDLVASVQPADLKTTLDSLVEEGSIYAYKTNTNETTIWYSLHTSVDRLFKVYLTQGENS